MDHVLFMQFGDTFKYGDQERAELAVIRPAARRNVLTYISTWKELAEQVWMVGAVVGRGQHASTEDAYHARGIDALHGAHFALKARGIGAARDHLARFGFAILDDPPALAHAAGRADARRLLARP